MGNGNEGVVEDEPASRPTGDPAATSSRWSEVAAHAGFIASAALALWILRSSRPYELGVGSLGYMAMVIVSALIAAIMLAQRQRIAVLVLIAIESAAIIGTTAARAQWPTERTVLLASAFFVVALTAIVVLFRSRPVVVCRVSVVAYVLFGVAAAIVAGVTTRSALMGVVSGLVLLIFLGVANYGIQLFVEHRPLIGATVRLLRSRTSRLSLARAALLLLPAFALTFAGTLLYRQIELTFRSSIYEDVGLLRMDPASTASVAERNIERDVLHTLHAAEDSSLRRVAATVDSVETSSERLLLATPESVNGVLVKMRPSLIPNAPCDRLQFRVLRKRVTFRSGCRALIADYNRRLQRSYETRAAATQEKIDSLSSQGVVTLGSKAQILREEMSAAVRASFAELRGLAGALFVVAAFTKAIGAAILVGGLLAAIQLVFGRIVFNQPGFASQQDGIPALMDEARLQLELGMAAPLKVSTLPQLPLGNSHLLGSDEGWWVYSGIGRTGVGSVGSIGVPNKFTMLLSRLLSGRLFMHRVRPMQPVSTMDPPVLTKDGDLLFVCIELNPGQPVTVKLQDVVAFTPTVRLESVYTTHVAAHFLGLGSFYCVARVTGEEPGTLVLLSQGSAVECPKGPKCTPAYSILAWDQRARFGLAQSLSLEGVWFADPFLVSSEPLVLVVDEGAPPPLQWARRLWRLLRYTLLPF